MTDFFARTYFGNTMGQWLTAAGIVIGAVLVGRIVYWTFGRFIKRAVAKARTKLANLIVDLGEEPLVYAVTVAGVWVAYRTLDTSPGVDAFTAKVFFILFAIGVAWLLTRLNEALFEEYLKPLAAGTDRNLDDQLLAIARKFIKVAIWVLAAIIVMSNSGDDVAAILAGLGLGGLAFALAAMRQIEILEDHNFHDIAISVKSTNVNTAFYAYKILATMTEYPFHVGITEAGTTWPGSIKSAVGSATD